MTVSLDEQGYVLLGDRKLSQREAVDLAAALVQGAQDSIYRGQVGTSHYHSSQGILERQESKMGKAISALRKVYG